MDNLGYGEIGAYGGGVTRGGATPRLDTLAEQGVRLTNYNVEAQCTPSRAALMTGRYAVRTGNGSVPLDTGMYGLTQWEYTMAEMLSDAGYTTAMFGKWHLGQTPGRYPTDQGFDEWYGIPNSTDESYWPSQAQFNAVAKEQISPYAVAEYVYDGRKGAEPKPVKVYDLDVRPEIDGELTAKALDFIDRQTVAKKPFFLFVPYTIPHMPVVASKEFAGASGKSKWGDVLIQMDTYVGRLLDRLEEKGISDNTIFIFTSDNGPEMIPGQHGWSGPWRGSYFTGLEGSLRVPFIVRWPGKIPAGVVSDEIVHEMDLYSTLAAWTGGKVPSDRIIDSLDQSAFLAGTQQKSSRDSVVVYVGNDLFGVKWRNWKMMFKEVERGTDEKMTFDFPRMYNLYDDPKEEYQINNETAQHFWVRWPMGEVLKAHQASVAEEPLIRPGTPDPYSPPKAN
ncbi:Arylsulfatase [Mesorhizobium ventifaucium]|uniref:Arylsulfatase n=2 Tax=Mesorhizobium ventifaucium TaxID=666020 RepID=A0ABN8KEF1_9HYPH|nr:Arylsulfatase [Mesorhizobium ventifaucium]